MATRTVLLALVGERCSGKSTVSRYLRRRGARFLRYSDVLTAILRSLGRDHRSTANLQALGGALRSAFGEDVLTQALVHRLGRRTHRFTVLDGMRKPGELRAFRRLPHARVLYVTAPVRLRHARSSARGFRREDGIDLAAFRRLEQNPAERDIPRVGRSADFRIDNVGTEAELLSQVDALLRRLTR